MKCTATSANQRYVGRGMITRLFPNEADPVRSDSDSRVDENRSSGECDGSQPVDPVAVQAVPACMLHRRCPGKILIFLQDWRREQSEANPSLGVTLLQRKLREFVWFALV